MVTKEMLENKIEYAKAGRAMWCDLEMKKDIAADIYVILFPQSSTRCNEYMLKYLPQYAEKVSAKRFLFLTVDENVAEYAKKIEYVSCKSIMISRKQAEELMAYYTLQMFTDKLIIAALDEPEGRNGKNIIGIKGITEEEAVAIGILGLKECE